MGGLTFYLSMTSGGRLMSEEEREVVKITVDSCVTV